MKYGVYMLVLSLLAGPALAQTCGKGSIALTRYKLAGEVVTDSQTGLSWRRCLEGQTWTGKLCKGQPRAMSISEAASWVAKLNQGPGADWRLPTQDELLTLVDRECSDPAINLKAFPGTPPVALWTSTSSGGTGFWSVSFSDGFEEIYNGNRALPVRLVRQ